jgi:hypothetical protein
MQSIAGQVSAFLHDSRGEIQGLLLNGGQVVRFPVDQSHLVALVINIGSHVAVEGLFRSGNPAAYLEAALITNLDSRRSVTFLAPKCQDKPGMLLQTTPNSTASLAHPYPPSEQHRAEKETAAGTTEPVSHDPCLDARTSQPEVQPSSSFHDTSSGNPHRPSDAPRSEAASGIASAYDRLHRVQAILAYLHIMKRQVPGISQFLDESKHTYGQALSRYEVRNFTAAAEFAAASASLSRVVEIIMARTLRSDSSFPSLVPPPPENFLAFTDSSHIDHDLAEAESVLSRVHWLLENGTMPLDDRTQVRRIANWGDALYKQACHMHRRSSLPDAAELAKAALAGAHSAEHVCRKWYIGQSEPQHQVFVPLRP